MSEIEKRLAVVREALLQASAIAPTSTLAQAYDAALSALSDVERAVGEMRDQIKVDHERWDGTTMRNVQPCRCDICQPDAPKEDYSDVQF